MSESETRKLRILCLHGWNNTGNILMYQMQNFINTFGDLCEFTFLDGPNNVEDAPPIQTFVDKGIPSPFKRWVRFKHSKSYTRRTADGSVEVTINSAETNYDEVTETVFYIVDFMNRQEEPFDGFCSFSQGG